MREDWRKNAKGRLWVKRWCDDVVVEESRCGLCEQSQWSLSSSSLLEESSMCIRHGDEESIRDSWVCRRGSLTVIRTSAWWVSFSEEGGQLTLSTLLTTKDWTRQRDLRVWSDFGRKWNGQEREREREEGNEEGEKDLLFLASPSLLSDPKKLLGPLTHVGIPLSFLLLFDHHKFLKRRSERKTQREKERI